MPGFLVHFLLILFLSFTGIVSGQQVLITKYIPGKYLRDNLHRIDFFNTGNTSISLGGYLLVTRDYSVILPRKVVIPPKEVYRIGKKESIRNELDLELSRTADFLIRFASQADNGNFVILFDQKGRIVDGMYFCPTPEVPFLPDGGACITDDRDTVYFSIPSENNIAWKNGSVGLGYDPAVCFIQLLSRIWLPVSINKNLLPSTDYQELQGNYFDGVIKLEWKTSFEDQCFAHEVERSQDGRSYAVLEKIKAQGSARKISEYQFYDARIEQGKSYFYRIRTKDIYGYRVSSESSEVLASTEPADFSMEVFLGRIASSGELNVRFKSRKTESIRIKILDNRFREVMVLYDDLVEEGMQNLLKVKETLPPSKYLIMADTGEKRYFKEILIPE